MANKATILVEQMIKCHNSLPKVLNKATTYGHTIFPALATNIKIPCPGVPDLFKYFGTIGTYSFVL